MNYKKKIAYIDCFSGISGDMFLGALIDAGLPEEELKSALENLPLKGYELQITIEKRHSITGSRIQIKINDPQQKGRSFKDIMNIILKSELPDETKEKSIKIFSLLAEAEARIHGCKMEDIHFHELGAVDSILDIVGSMFGIEYMNIDGDLKNVRNDQKYKEIFNKWIKRKRG